MGIVEPGSLISSASVAMAEKPKNVMNTSALVTPMLAKSVMFSLKELATTAGSNAPNAP